MNKIKDHLLNKQKIYEQLKLGKVLLTATDTLYGFLSLDQKSIYDIKKRSLKKN